MTQQHLLPSQVEELRALGVEFEDTMLYWCIGSNGYQNSSPTYRDVIEEAISVKNPHAPNVEYNILPAPDLQKVLEKLPKTIESDSYFADYFLRIEWTLGNEECCMFYDHEARYDKEVDDGSFGTSDPNPLLAAFKLLKLVATNHPKSLPKT